MAADILDTKWRQGYSIVCEIETKDGVVDFSNNVQRVRMVGSIATKYPIYIIELLVESEFINHLELYGQFDIYLYIYTTYEDMTTSDVHTANLIYIKKDDTEYKQRPIENLVVDSSASTQETVILSCIPKKAYKLMTKEINYYFGEDWVGAWGSRSPLEALLEIGRAFKLDYENWGWDETAIIKGIDWNPTPLPRTYVVPRMTFASLLDFLDRDDFGGFYDGPSVHFFGSDVMDEVLFVQGVRDALWREPFFTIHLVPLNTEIDDILKEVTEQSDRVFYTKVPIQVKYFGQKDISTYGGKHVIRAKPLHTLFQDFVFDMEDILRESSAISSEQFNPLDYIHPLVKETTTYSHFLVGHEDSVFIKTKIAKKVSYIYELITQVSGRLPISEIMNYGMGTCVDIRAYSNDYLRYTGYHLLIGFDISIDRTMSDRYMLNVKFRCARTNVAEY